jgi:hypothetical protein
VSAQPRFVLQEHVRCEDCDIRGDLHETGHPLKDAKGRIWDCAPCGGHGHHDVVRPDPYSEPVAKSDVYAARRAHRAEHRSLTNVPRELRRRFFELAHIEALMAEEPA